MLDDDKVLIISNEHNHLPPFLLRDENGTLVSSYLMKAEPKNRKKEKATIGPLASRKEVESLVASIMKSVRDMENNVDTAAPCTSDVTPETETKAFVSVDVTPDNSKFSASKDINNETFETNLICSSCYYKEKTPEQTKTGSAVTINNKREPLEKVTADSQTCPAKVKCDENNVTKGKSVEESTGFSQMSTDKEHLVPHEIKSAPLIKHDTTGSLIPNQMYIVLPQNDAGIPIHNRFIMSYQNASGLLYNNRILVTPIKTESSTTVTWNNQMVQPRNNETFSITNHVVPQQSYSSGVVPNKTILLFHNSNTSPLMPRINENASFVSKTETGIPTEAGPSAPNQMFIIVQKKNETNSLGVTNTQLEQTVNNANCVPSKETQIDNVPRNMQNITPKKHQMKTSIPIASIKNIKFPNKSSKGSNNLSKGKETDAVSSDVNVLPKKSDTNREVISQVQNTSTVFANKPETENVFSKMQSIKLETSSSMTSSNNSPPTKTMCVEPCNIQPLTPKKTEPENAVSINTQPIASKKTISDNTVSKNLQQTLHKTENTSVGSNKIKPIALKKTEIGNVVPSKTPQVSQHKVKTASTMTSSTLTKGSEIVPYVGINKVYTLKKKDTKSDDPNKKQQIAPKKIESGGGEPSKMQQGAPKKIESCVAGSSKVQPIEPKTVKTGNVASDYVKQQKVLKKIESACSTTSNINISAKPKQLDKNWIIPKKSSGTKQSAENKTRCKEIDIPVPISVSMIPLPKDESGPSGINTNVTAPTETNSVSKEVLPSTIVQKQPIKHKAGSNMHSVPPKKRYYEG